MWNICFVSENTFHFLDLVVVVDLEELRKIRKIIRKPYFFIFIKKRIVPALEMKKNWMPHISWTASHNGLKLRGFSYLGAQYKR